MPNGIDWKRITGEEVHPLEKLRDFLKNFAQQEGFRLYVNSYHDSLHVELSKKIMERNGGRTVRIIRMGLLEVGDKLLCSINVSAEAHTGFTGLLKRLIPFVGKPSKKSSRELLLRREKEVGRLGFPIDQHRLASLLTTAKETLEVL